MRGREIPLFFSFLFSCVRGIPAESPLTSGDGRCFIHRNYYYEFVPGEVTWTEAERLCRQKFGFLATILTAEDNLKLLSLMQPVGVKHPLWIGAKLKKTGSGSFGSQILAFSGRTDTKFARLLKQFPQMHSVTVCAQLQFDSNYVGVSTIFSYSIPSFINEFQLRANIVHEAQIQLALLVHGVHSPYSQTIENDGRWHHICVKWIRRGGSWAIAVDGSIVASGDDLYLSDDIGQDGVFIVGQEQDTFGGSFKQDESFIGNITQLHIWNRDLDSSEIQALAEDCSVPQTGLFFQWNISALQVEPTVQVYEVFSQCKGLGFKTYEPFYISWVDGSVTPFHNISSDINITIAKEECITFDPLNGAWISEICSQLKETFCRYKKDVYEHMQIFSSVPPSPFFLQVKKIPTGGSIADYLLLNNSDYPQTVDRANNITKLLLETVDESDVSLTTVDLLALTRLLENVAYLGFETEANNSETLLNLATNYAQLASKIIDSRCSLQWLEVSEVIPGPYIIIHNFDLVAEKLADVSTSIGSDIVLSTENIDLRITTKQLPDLENGLVYKPACISARDRADEIQIPNFEVLRLLTLGYSELIFIHAYYRSLEHLYNPNSVLLAAKSGSSLQSRQLGTAVISSTVRDPLTARNLPVAVQYSLSHGALVGFPKFFKPECVFWNFSLQNGRFAGWSRQGCQVIQFEPEVTFCFCNHTTNFAVLLQFTEIQWSAEVESILNKLTFIGSGASLCALVVTLTLFTVLDIPKSDRTSIHKNLFVALIAAQVVLLSSDSATSNKVACVIVAALLHLFFMAAFAWMMVEGLLLWSKVVTVNLSEERRMKYYYLVGWGLPFLIVSITLAAAHDIYVADGHCWLNVHNGVIWAFVGPVIFIIMVNMFVLTRVVMITMSTAKRRAIMLAINSSPIEQAYDQIRAAMKAVLVLLPILGLTWLCGVLVPFSVVMAYIFVILNSLQGLFIFLIYGVYNTEVRSTIKRIKERRKALNFSNCASSRPSSSLTSSRPASSPVTGTESLAKDVGLHNGDGVNVQGICKMSFYDNSVIYENPAAANDRQLSTPSLSRGPDEELSCCSQSPVTSTKLTSEPPKRASEKGCKADCSLPGGLESMEDGCSLHVPTEFDEEPSCSLKSTSLKRVGSLYLD